MKIADERHLTACIIQASSNLRHRGGCFRHVDRDPYHFRAGLGQLGALRCGGCRIGCVGHRHRLHDYRRAAADLNIADAHTNRLVYLHFGHGSDDST